MKVLIDIYVDKLISLGGKSSSIFMGKESSKVFYFSKYSDMINNVDNNYVCERSYILKKSNKIDKLIYNLKKEQIELSEEIINLEVEKKEIKNFPKIIDGIVKESKKISIEKGVDTLCFGHSFIEIITKEYVFRAPLYFEEVIVKKDSKKYTFETGIKKWNINLLHTLYLKIHNESFKLDLNNYTFENSILLLKDMNIVDLVINDEISILNNLTQESLKNSEPQNTLYTNIITLGIYDSKLLTIYMETKKLAESGEVNNLNLKKIFDIKSNFELNAKSNLAGTSYSEDTKSIIQSDTFHNVTDVDFSQAEVVQSAINNTLVVKGPPGTGKTETILNILANNYIAGKKVLVVAEKLVALEVLYKRIVKNAEDMSKNTLFLKRFDTSGKLEIIEKSRNIYNNNQKNEVKAIVENNINYPLNSIEHDQFINYKDQFKQMENFNPLNVPNNYDIICNELVEYSEIVSDYDELQNIFKNYIDESLYFDTFLYNKRTYDYIYNDINLYSFNYEVINEYHKNFNENDQKILELNVNEIEKNITSYLDVYTDFAYMKEVIKIEDYNFYLPQINDTNFNYKQLKEKYNELIKQTNIKNLNRFYINYEVYLKIEDKFVEYKNIYLKHNELKNDANYMSLFDDVEYYMDFLTNNDYKDKLHLLIKKKSYNDKYSFGIVNEISSGFVKLKGEEQDYYLEIFNTFLAYNDLMKKINKQVAILKLEVDEYEVIVKLEKLIREITQFKGIENNKIVEVILNTKHKKNLFKYSVTEYEFLEKYNDLLQIFEEKQLFNYTPKQLTLFINYKKIIQIHSENIYSIPSEYVEKYLFFCEVLGYTNNEKYKKFFNVSSAEILASIEFNSCLDIYVNRKKHVEEIIKYRKNIIDTYKTKTSIAKNLVSHMHRSISEELYTGEFSKGFFAIRENKVSFKKSIRSMIHDYNDEFKQMFPIVISSPINVSSVLQYKDFANHFDLVIFDEASQLLPEFAIYSLALGKDYIIVGDDKQLQPSNFFATTTSNDDVAEVLETSEDNESLLDIANRNLASVSKKMLNYHYRSESDLLIKFSNDEFYDSKLIAISNSKYDDIAFEVVKVDNATWEEQYNLKEAEKVVETIMKVKLKYPNKTLGIITVNTKQVSKIEELITYNMRNNEAFSNLFKDEFELSEDKDYIFVKNIENVQGDERDIIIFSLAYAKNNKGIINANYGAINKKGGANRLNVAFSRAKYKFVLVKSVNANELKVTNAIGSILLHKFVSLVEECDQQKYFKTEQLNNSGFDSPYEEEVFNKICDVIDHSKYNVINQYGSSGYTIDIVITNKNHQPILGIECDGATYHSSRDAKNRDYFRQKYLEDRGWTIHRIWSTSWWENRDKEINKILTILTKLNSLTTENYVTEMDINTSEFNKLVSFPSDLVSEEMVIEKDIVITNDVLVEKEVVAPKVVALPKVASNVYNIMPPEENTIEDTKVIISEETTNIIEEQIDISNDFSDIKINSIERDIAPRDNIALVEKYALYDEVQNTLKLSTSFRKKLNRAICVPAPRDNIKLVNKYALYDEVISKLYAIKDKNKRKQITSSPEYDIMNAYKETYGKHKQTDKYIKLLLKQIDDKKQSNKVNYISKSIEANNSYIITKDISDEHNISPGVYRFKTKDSNGQVVINNIHGKNILTIDLVEEVNESINNYDPEVGYKALVLEEGNVFETTNSSIQLIPVNSSK